MNRLPILIKIRLIFVTRRFGPRLRVSVAPFWSGVQGYARRLYGTGCGPTPLRHRENQIRPLRSSHHHERLESSWWALYKIVNSALLESLKTGKKVRVMQKFDLTDVHTMKSDCQSMNLFLELRAKYVTVQLGRLFTEWGRMVSWYIGSSECVRDMR